MADTRGGSCNYCGFRPSSGTQEYRCNNCGTTFCTACGSNGCPHCGANSYQKWYWIQN